MLQVLQECAFPVLLAFPRAKALQEGQMLNPLRSPEATAACCSRLRMGPEEAHRGLQWLPKLQYWTLLGLLLCPGQYWQAAVAA